MADARRPSPRANRWRAPKGAASLDELAASYGDVQLATLSAELPRAGAWSYELKYDGYRIVGLKSGQEVRLVSRRGQDWTTEFEAVALGVADLRAPACVLDGEVCAIDSAGRTSFQLLQNRSRGIRLVYFVFDLLYDGHDLRQQPIEARRERLVDVVGSPGDGSTLRISSAVHGDAETIFRAACSAGLEGVVAKQDGAFYSPGRARSWLKIKCTHRQEFAIVGWLPLQKSRPMVGSLVLAVMEPDGHFHFAGKVGTGFADATRKTLWNLLRGGETERPTAVDVPRFGGLVHFVEPRHIAEVTFTEWTSGGHVRHPSFQGLREDKLPEQCVRERAAASAP